MVVGKSRRERWAAANVDRPTDAEWAAIKKTAARVPKSTGSDVTNAGIARYAKLAGVELDPKWYGRVRSQLTSAGMVKGGNVTASFGDLDWCTRKLQKMIANGTTQVGPTNNLVTVKRLPKDIVDGGPASPLAVAAKQLTEALGAGASLSDPLGTALEEGGGDDLPEVKEPITECKLSYVSPSGRAGRIFASKLMAIEGAEVSFKDNEVKATFPPRGERMAFAAAAGVFQQPEKPIDPDAEPGDKPVKASGKGRRVAASIAATVGLTPERRAELLEMLKRDIVKPKGASLAASSNAPVVGRAYVNKLGKSYGVRAVTAKTVSYCLTSKPEKTFTCSLATWSENAVRQAYQSEVMKPEHGSTGKSVAASQVRQDPKVAALRKQLKSAVASDDVAGFTAAVKALATLGVKTVDLGE